jgi:hypothetical protein
VPAKAQAELVGPQWLDDAKADGLEGTAWWQAKVLGQFPDTASDQVIPLNLVETARANAHTPDAREAAGLDVARFGSDDTALVEGSGNGPELVTVVHGHDTMAVAGLGARFLAGRRGVLAVDEGGVGGGVLDRLREQRLPGNVLGVNAGSGADNDPDDRLVNMRAQLWWTAREALYRGEVSLARLPDDAYARLRSELTAPTYRFTSGGKVQIESKEELKKRGISSPTSPTPSAYGYTLAHVADGGCERGSRGSARMYSSGTVRSLSREAANAIEDDADEIDVHRGCARVLRRLTPSPTITPRSPSWSSPPDAAQ